MTVIAWDGKTLAADRQMTWNDMRTTVCKIQRMPNGEVIGATGDSAKALGMLQWYERGAKPEAWPEWQTAEDYARLIVARPGKRLVYFDWIPVEQPIFDPFMAFGSGRDYAMAAMAMGADAVKAVEITNQFCASTGLGVDSLDVGEE